jgi:hypothetical protein
MNPCLVPALHEGDRLTAVLAEALASEQLALYHACRKGVASRRFSPDAIQARQAMSYAGFERPPP